MKNNHIKLALFASVLLLFSVFVSAQGGCPTIYGGYSMMGYGAGWWVFYHLIGLVLLIALIWVIVWVILKYFNPQKKSKRKQ